MTDLDTIWFTFDHTGTDVQGRPDDQRSIFFYLHHSGRGNLRLQFRQGSSDGSLTSITLFGLFVQKFYLGNLLSK